MIGRRWRKIDRRSSLLDMTNPVPDGTNLRFVPKDDKIRAVWVTICNDVLHVEARRSLSDERQLAPLNSAQVISAPSEVGTQQSLQR